jgi:hypothetical protein
MWRASISRRSGQRRLGADHNRHRHRRGGGRRLGRAARHRAHHLEQVRRVGGALGRAFRIPVELIVATIATQSRGDPKALRLEPDYVDDDKMPDKVSPGLMQTLISTARDVLRQDDIDRAWLLEPDNSIRAGTACIDRQRRLTLLDPPKVACAYNAGGLYHDPSAANRWKMRQYPPGRSSHGDRFVQWFNDCIALFDESGAAPAMSFYRMLQEQAVA